MQSDASRAVADGGTNGSPCLGRRGLVTGFAAFAATSGLAATAPVNGPYDQAIHYLGRSFQTAANQMLASAGREQTQAFLKMIALANAMSLVPAVEHRAIEIKRGTAAWSHREGELHFCLPMEVVDALNASARRDG
ncbi:hypothetical protein [Rhizobium etli]|uniref:hypothetical protein n=1 Tax=Rhizobium etli TaxID=29449 RepID=UPI00093C0300|nr:hypothetical protein [Rhizobium etli]